MKTKLVNKHEKECRAGKNPFVLGEHKFIKGGGVYMFVCNDSACDARLEVPDNIIDKFVNKLATN